MSDLIEAPPANPVAEFHQTLHGLTPRVFVTPILIAINVAIFGWMLLEGVHPLEPTAEQLIGWGANFGPQTTGGEWWRLGSSMFLHIGALHILFNMWVLWDAGRLVERLLGNAGFLIVYAAAGLAGSLASVWWNPFVVSAGASGAVFGVYGALIGFLARRRGCIPSEVLSGLSRGVLAFVGYNLLFGLSQKGIDMAAHVGGLGAGLLAGLVFSQPVNAAARAGRLGRNLIVAVGAAALLAGAAHQVAGGTADWRGALDQFTAVEDRVINRFNDAVGKARAGELTDAQMADILEKEMLPEWREARERLAGLDGLPDEPKRIVDRLVEYAKPLRQDGWELFAAGLRDGDAGKITEAQKKQQQAEELTKEIGKD